MKTAPSFVWQKKGTKRASLSVAVGWLSVSAFSHNKGRLTLFRRYSRKRFDRNLLVTTLQADHHLVLVADGHFQLHRVVLFHDSARSAHRALRRLLSC